MFQRLGLRYVLFADKGVLQGLLTKKDVWSIIDGAESRKDKGLDIGSLRQRNTAEEIGLLESDDGTSFASSLDRRPSI
jgi:chloride channel 3/4/5